MWKSARLVAAAYYLGGILLLIGAINGLEPLIGASVMFYALCLLLMLFNP